MGLKPGQYRGMLVDYAFGETPQSKDLQVNLYFDIFKLPEGMTVEAFDELVKEGKAPQNLPTEQMTKFSNFNGGAKEITLDMLLKLGFDPKRHTIAKIEEGPSGQALNMSRIYGLSLKDEGQYGMKISSVYIPGEGGFMGKKLQRGEAASRLASMGLDGELQKRAASVGDGPVNQAPAQEGRKARF